MSKFPKILLAFDAAIAGGSISLMRGADEIAHKIGAENILKAENLLPQIRDLLDENGLMSEDIGNIAVSAGPGSFTGIRIGLATALGLARSLNVSQTSISTLEAMAHRFAGTTHVICAVPMGRKAVCIQEFQNSSGMVETSDDPQSISESTFKDLLQKKDRHRVVLHESLADFSTGYENWLSVGENVAFLIGSYWYRHPNHNTESPIFISKHF